MWKRCETFLLITFILKLKYDNICPLLQKTSIQGINTVSSAVSITVEWECCISCYYLMSVKSIVVEHYKDI